MMLDDHSKEVVNRIDSLLTIVDAAIDQWTATKVYYELSHDLIIEGNRILEEERANRNN